MAKLEKTLTIDGREICFRASGLTPIVYNRLFRGRDYFRDLELLQNLEAFNDIEEEEEKTSFPLTVDDYDQFMRICFCMAYQGLGKGVASPEHKAFLDEYPDMYAWIDSFGSFDMVSILGDVIELWAGNAETVVKTKNAHPAPPVK